MKYKVLKDCILNHKFYEIGETYEDPYAKGDKQYLEEAVKHGFLEKIPEKPETVWGLKEGDECWGIRGGCIAHWVHMCTSELVVVKKSSEVGDIFLTKEEAVKELARRKAKQILLKDTKGYKPVWDEHNPNNYEVYYGYRGKKLEFTSYCNCRAHADLWFASGEDAKASIKAHEKEWKVYLGVEE